MPAIEDVYIELQCQQKISSGAPIEEFAPRHPRADDPEGQFMPKLYDANTRTCSVFIPVFPQAQFFLNYHVEVPADQSQFYVFKLIVNGDEFVTWSCGMEHGFCGKTQFGLFDTSKGDGKGLEKRAMYFGAECRIIGDLTVDKDEHRLLEVRVYRGNKKMRVPRDSERYDGRGSNTEISIADAGRVETGHPKRFYLFGLKDPLDKPHATFRFYYRSWEEIAALRLKMGQVDDKDLTQLFCSRSTQVLKDEKRKTLSINSGPTWLRFPGPNNPPIKDRDYYQAFGHTQRPAAQVQQQVSNTLWRNPVVNLPHASNYAKVHRSSFSDQAHTQPYQPLHSWYSSNTHQPLHGPRGLHQPFAHHLPRRPLQPVIPLRESSCSSGPNLPMRLSIPPSMILPPNHPHSMSIPRMSPTKADDQRPLPRLPGYPVPPPPAAGYQ